VRSFFAIVRHQLKPGHLPRTEQSGGKFDLFDKFQYERFRFGFFKKSYKMERSEIPIHLLIFWHPPPHPALQFCASQLVLPFVLQRDIALEAGLKWVYGALSNQKLISQFGDP
jgi:hypothetical protein